MLSTGEENRRYDFKHPDNADKWQGLFVISLRKILEQEHPELTIDDLALEYAESLCLQLLGVLCDAPAPLTLQDVEHRLLVLPSPIDKWAQGELREAQAQPRNQRRRFILPVDKLHNLLQKEVMLYKIDMSVTLLFATIIEYVTTDILRLAGNFVKKISSATITDIDLKASLCADKVLLDLFHPARESITGPVSVTAVTERRASLSYADLMRELLVDVKSFLRDLNLIIRVFKDELDKILDHDSKSCTVIFGNIVDIYELTATLLGNLEDAVEASHDSPTPYIGNCFEELLEVQEFYSFERYAKVVTSTESRDALQHIFDDPALWERLETGGHGFGLAVKYYLPRLLLTPVTHVFVYHNHVQALFRITPHTDDKEILRQVESDLNKHMGKIKDIINKSCYAANKEITMPVSSRRRRQLAIEKCFELSKVIDKWDSRDMGPFCNEFYREIKEIRIGSNLRQAFLFDGVLLLCKPGHSSSTNHTGLTHLKLKEKLHVRKLDIVDRQDTEELKNCVELGERSGVTIILSFATSVDKRNWISDLVILNTKPMLDRTLDSILSDLERRHPLKLPPPEIYRFSEPDSPDNIILEEKHGAAPLIKGATLLKLVERLTYHVHADLFLVRSFLITYRHFCSPTELLELLVERFNIPEPSEVYDCENGEIVPTTDAEKLSKSSIREDWKRYRKEFLQPVKFRVINVFRHWVDQHFYDFQRDPELLKKLVEFLEPIQGKPMRKWVQSVLKIIERKSSATGEEASTVFSFSESPPAVLRHVADVERYHWNPLVLHPIELARQLTLLEFSLYRQVKPSEIVGSVWTKANKEETSPNLLKAIRLTTNFTRWMQKCILECENIEERVATLTRFLDMGVELRNLNNFNGVLAVVSACASAAVYRLKATFSLLSPRLHRALEMFKELNSDHFRRYNEQLRSINPPCVPFFGKYLTEVLHTEEGNRDFLSDSHLINFMKRRMVADIIGEIQQYQNQPYCLIVEKNTRAFLEKLDPFPGQSDNEIQDYLYAKSLEIEPRQPIKQMPKFPRKYPELSLKPVKDSRRHHTTHQIIDETKSGVVPVSPTRSESSITVANEDRNGRLDVGGARVERCGSSASQVTPGGDRNKQKNRRRWSGREEPPSPQESYSPRHDRATPSTSQSWRPAALSPRGAIVDSDTFYNISHEHRRWDDERVPPLLPRGPTYVEEPPPTPPRHIIVTTHAQVVNPPSSPRSASADEPPERPPPSPMHEINNDAECMRSSSCGSGGSAGQTFSFPSPAHLAATSSYGTPPPLPPRRIKPPPLPPRSQVHELSCPNQGTIWQRRKHTVSIGPPKLPPKPVVSPEEIKRLSHTLPN